MKESAERVVEIGFIRNPKRVVNEVERLTAEMIREGWELSDTCVEENLGNVHLFFEREVLGDE
jgi:hypothetical protein